MDVEEAVVQPQAFAHAAQTTAAAAQGKLGVAAAAIVDDLQLQRAGACDQPQQHVARLRMLGSVVQCFLRDAEQQRLQVAVERGQRLDLQFDIELHVEPLPALDGDLQTLLFRVAQEALNNTAKHAHARNVLLRLVARGGTLQLQLVDDGNGCDPEGALRSGGSGLGGMRERLRLYDGHLEIHSAPGQGTRIRAVVPIAGNA